MPLTGYVEYVTAPDGVVLACVTYGEDRDRLPLVCTRTPFLSHLQHELSLPFETMAHEFERMSAVRRILRFDARGCGLSDREPADLSLDARVSDIEAVVDHFGLERFAIQGHICMGSVAIAYAAKHPERVARLILSQAYTTGREFWGGADGDALIEIARVDWTTYTEMAARRAFGWTPGPLPQLIAEHMRYCMDQAGFLRFVEADREVDVRELLPLVVAPTLINYHAFEGVATREAAIRLAAALPDAELALLTTADFDELLRTFDAFLDD